MYDHKPKSNASLRKNHKQLTERGVGGGGGGSILTVSLTVKYPLFLLTASLSVLLQSQEVYVAIDGNVVTRTEDV